MPSSIRPFLGNGQQKTSAATGGAELLILLGCILQLGAFGFGPFTTAHLWILRVVLGHVWDIFAASTLSPDLASQTQYWPLLLVGLGVAILFDRRRRRPRRIASGSAVHSGVLHVQ